MPGFHGYVDVGALELYCERHGTGPPLVLLHGAFGTIESCFAGLLPALAHAFEVVAVELQGHGRTRSRRVDIARRQGPLSWSSGRMPGNVRQKMSRRGVENPRPAPSPA
jgi:pimeloyl-ACP methyl ester carboxylesterase